VVEILRLAGEGGAMRGLDWAVVRCGEIQSYWGSCWSRCPGFGSALAGEGPCLEFDEWIS